MGLGTMQKIQINPGGLDFPSCSPCSDFPGGGLFGAFEAADLGYSGSEITTGSRFLCPSRIFVPFNKSLFLFHIDLFSLFSSTHMFMV